MSEKAGSRKGGLKTMPFIIANEALEKIAAYGLQPNMILYLITSYNFSAAGGTNLMFIWGAISNFLPILGAFLSDSYLGRFLVIAIATPTTLLGLIALWLTAIIQELRPAACDPRLGKCSNPNAGQLAFLYMSFILMSIGAGGIRPCSMAFGADQFNNPKNPNNQRILDSFFNWYYASVGVSLMFAVTIIVYIQNKYKWIVGFGVPVGLMFVSTIAFFLGSKLYVKIKPNRSLLTGLVQVVVAAWRNRRRELMLPEDSDRQLYYHTKGSKHVVPTNKLSFLNKACMLQNPEKDLNPDGSPTNPWRLCSVQQVEVLKSVIELIPMWSTGIIIGVTISQQGFPVLQAATMDRHLAGDFKIPPGSFGLFGITTLTIWVVLYDRIVVPYLSKNSQGIGVKARVGTGLFISCLATATAALVERKRRTAAIHQGLADTPKAQVDMSAMWLIPQHCLVGLGEAFNAIAQIELYYSQFPKSMASIAVALFTLGLGVANLLGSLIVTIIDTASKRGGKVSWVSTNLNKGHYDYYYWVLTILSVANFIYFNLIACKFYKCCEEDKVWDEDEDHEDVGKIEVQKSVDSSSSMYLSA
ncbi:protein NRT1/ PTR FAMILY 1.2-like [Andrographis paniculata]|uniref:protein NRT1/ PTR FAMILY 1.2-like n=1 Tax=Andrographis paniculata TaxID=175694 RepID=UPI0021E7501D|nr:protein NRT1/ PTR FAMILY 1.2-like [Andrographis paniculata]